MVLPEVVAVVVDLKLLIALLVVAVLAVVVVEALENQLPTYPLLLEVLPQVVVAVVDEEVVALVDQGL